MRIMKEDSRAPLKLHRKRSSRHCNCVVVTPSYEELAAHIVNRSQYNRSYLRLVPVVRRPAFKAVDCV